MSFIVEDGTKIENANAYITVSEADNYSASVNNLDWPNLTQTQKQSKIVKATEFIDSLNWSTGTKKSREQGLNWPRNYAYDQYGFSIANDVVPIEVKQATTQLSLIAINKTDLNAGSQIVTKEKVGSLEVEYSEMFNSGNTDEFKKIKDTLKGLIDKNNDLVRT